MTRAVSRPFRLAPAKAPKSLTLNRHSVLSWSGRVPSIKTQELPPLASGQAALVSYRAGPLVLPSAHIDFSGLRGAIGAGRRRLRSLPKSGSSRSDGELQRDDREAESAQTRSLESRTQSESNLGPARWRIDDVSAQTTHGSGAQRPSQSRMVPQMGTQAPCVREVSLGAATEPAEPCKKVCSRRTSNPRPAGVVDQEGGRSATCLSTQSRLKVSFVCNIDPPYCLT